MKALISFFMVAFTLQSAHAQRVTIDLDLDAGDSVSVSSNGMEISFGGRKMYRSRVSMGSGSIRIGSQVITRSGYTVKIIGGNPARQTVKVQYLTGSIEEKALSDIATTEGCNEVFCVGEKAITPSGYEVEIAGFFQDGRVAIQYLGGTLEQRSVFDLALTQACDGLFCTGDRAITSSNYEVRVAGIFADGRIAVQYLTGTLERRSADSLSITKAMCANIYANRVGVCR